MLFIRLIYESFSFAWHSLKVNKLRTLLSLLGITIGIFAIISVFTVIDSLERYIRNSLNSLGSNMVYIQKWPWTPPEGETEYPWWKYMNRPVPDQAEADELLRRSRLTENAAFFFGFTMTVQSGNDNMENAQILASSHPLLDVWSLRVSQGRYFTVQEMHSATPLAIIGSEIAERLFRDQNPQGRYLKIMGHQFQIIGVYERSGQDMFGTSMDKRVHIPVNYSMNMLDVRNRDRGQVICVRGRPGVSEDEFAAELQSVMRAIRRQKPLDENNFALNQVNLISNQFDAFFKVFNLAGWVIGGFSILVGGFGIANIMFVSVKERTRIIGIQKSLGAKRFFILMEYIFEAVVLSLTGGVIGLMLIFAGTLIFSYVSGMTILLTVGNIVMGLLISTVIGFLAGLLPARTAARMDPVAAINSL